MLFKVSGGKERIRRFLAEDHPDRLVAALHQDKTRRYTEAVIAGLVEIRPGVARLLGEAKAAGLKTAIVTTTSRVNVYWQMPASLMPAMMSSESV